MQLGKVAILRGPLLFCFDPARNPHVRLGSANATAQMQAGNALPVAAPVIDVKSVEGPVADGSVRPNGTALRVKAWSPGRTQQQTPDLTLLLTEFADPDGVLTYFPVAFPAAGTGLDDELVVK